MRENPLSLSSADRILKACCPESSVNVFEHAARIVAVVANAKKEKK